METIILGRILVIWSELERKGKNKQKYNALTGKITNNFINVEETMNHETVVNKRYTQQIYICKTVLLFSVYFELIANAKRHHTNITVD